MHPMILIHGFPLDSTMWQEQVKSLEGAGHKVFTPDLAGFGEKPLLPAPAHDVASIEGYAQDIHALIKAKAGGKAVIGGFSMGGYVLLALLREHPEDVAAAMFLNTRPDADGADQRTGRLNVISDVRKNGTAAFTETMAGKILGKSPPAAVKSKALAMMRRQSAEAVIAAQAAMARRRDQSDLLAELSMPVMIVFGAEDQLTPPSVAVSMQTHMPHAMLVQIASAGHLTPLEQPDAVNTAIKAFLATMRA